MNSSGDITKCVVPSRKGVFSFSTTWPADNSELTQERIAPLPPAAQRHGAPTLLELMRDCRGA